VSYPRNFRKEHLRNLRRGKERLLVHGKKPGRGEPRRPLMKPPRPMREGDPRGPARQEKREDA
jgi:hypothetical protein